MKTIFNIKNQRKFTLYILFAVAFLSFAVLLLCQIGFHVGISPLALTIAFIGIVFFGCLIVQIKSSPPW